MGTIEHRAHADLLLNAVDNLRGYRCAEQGPFLAHVDAVWKKAVTVTEQLEGAVEALERIARGIENPGSVGARPFTANELRKIAADAIPNPGGQ